MRSKNLVLRARKRSKIVTDSLSPVGSREVPKEYGRINVKKNKFYMTQGTKFGKFHPLESFRKYNTIAFSTTVMQYFIKIDPDKRTIYIKEWMELVPKHYQRSVTKIVDNILDGYRGKKILNLRLIQEILEAIHQKIKPGKTLASTLPDSGYRAE